MLDVPKGYKYWIDGDNGTELSPDAPDWAVKEFQEYMKFMSEKPEDGMIIRT